MLKLRESIESKKSAFDEAIKSAKSDNVALELLRDKKRFLCQNDLFYLCCLTGNDQIARYPEYYREFCDEVSLMNWKIVNIGMHKPNMYMLPVSEVSDDLGKDLGYFQRIYLCYRAFYKTTIVSKVHSLQLILNFPNIHILLAHNVEANASANLVAIKNYFLTTDLKYLFPKYIPKTKEWGNMTSFSVATRTDWGRDEHTLMAVGVDTQITGGHWQVAKFNDLVTQDSVNTKDQIEKTKDWDSRFNIGHFDDAQYAIIDYEGTRYHNADLYATKISNPRIKFIEYPLQKDKDPTNFRVENISNPARYSPEGIKDMQSDMWVYNCQMLLKPEDPARRQFTQAMIAYFDSIPRGCNFYLLVDPASKRKKKSDYTVMLIVAVGWVKGELKYLIVDGVRDKLNPKQRIDTAIDLAIKWGIRESGWEEVGLGDDNFYLEEKRREKQIYFTVTPVKTSQVSKEDRIRNILMPEYAQHKWLWPNKNSLVKYSLFDGKNYDLTVDMDFEMMQFPLCEHDDLLDTMTFLSKLNIIKPSEIKIVEDSKEMTFGEYSKIRDDRLKEFNRDPWKKAQVAGRV